MSSSSTVEDVVAKSCGSSAAAATTPSNDATAQKGGGLFDYLISRKKIHHSNIINTINNTPPSPSSSSSSESARSERMKYHRLANAAGSQYFGSLSIPLFHDDSDSDNNNDDHQGHDKTTNAAAATTVLSGADNHSSSSFWLAKFQTKKSQKHETTKNNELKSDNAVEIERSSSSLSWMNKAWQTVDSATDYWMSSPSLKKLPTTANSDSSDHGSSSTSAKQQQSSSSWWTAVPTMTISNAISSINLPNPFKDDKESNDGNTTNILDNHSTFNNNNPANNNNNNSNLLLPKIASRFEWATKRRNPYQAVIGRVDTDYYLLSSSGPVSSLLWGWTTRWILPTGWLFHHDFTTTTTQRELENGRDDKGGSSASVVQGMRRNGDEGMVVGMRRKSLPSEASVMAVKNLLVLVQQQQQQQQFDSNEDHHEEGDDQFKDGQSSPQQRRKSSSSPTLTPGHSPSADISFTPRSPSIQPFPDFPDLSQDSSSFESSQDHSPMLNDLYPSPRMTPVQSFHHQTSSLTLQHPKSVPSPLTLPKSSSSPIIRRHRSSSFQNSTTHSIHPSGNKTTNTSNNGNNNNQAADAEMAARLTEGTLRAYRDLALDEATELHSALHHWTLRWERPFLGWLEAGPTVWFSEKGYSPYVAGKKVSQIQAVLARRCAVIGEIQQHLWRANWQRGVAEWGMLGHGQGEWAAVMLEHGDMTDVGGATTPGPSPQNNQQQQGKKKRISMKIFNHSSFVGGNVRNTRGGQILVDDDALTRWSIDGIKVVRDQLYRAGMAGAQLPYYENWPNEVRHFNGDTVGHSDVEIDHQTWAKQGAEANHSDGTPSSIAIKDLPGMADEVSSLLQSIELNLDQQRQRRLNKLRPPSNVRRNWYMFALGIPAAAYATYHVW